MHDVVKQIVDAVAYAELPESPLSEEMNVPGMAGLKSRKFLNRLCSPEGCQYLEVGTHRGASLFAAAYGNKGHFAGIDNFSKFNSVNPEEVLSVNRKRFAESCNTRFYKGDCWAVAPTIPSGSVDVFFYDGDHSEQATGYSLSAFYNALNDTAVVIFDDWNLGGVRRGATASVESGAFRVLHRWEEFTDKNGDKNGWWNGIGVFAVEKTK